ncbi:MAG: hypothetical protein AAGC70_07030 [Pseudomonadota bacterium]
MTIIAPANDLDCNLDMLNDARAENASKHRRALCAATAFCVIWVWQISSAAAWDVTVSATGAQSKRTLSILFVGNSHILMPGFMDRVVRRIKATSNRRRAIRTRMIAKIGTTLTKTRKKSETLRVLRSARWDVVVLQESTTAFMTRHGRRGFRSAVQWFRKHKPPGAKLLLWQAWPQGARHALYHRRGVWGKWFKNPPRNPKQLFSWISTESKRVAEANATYISPIGSCWMSLPLKKRPYSRDRYHASPRGLSFIAKVLASSILATADGQRTKPHRVKGMCPQA